MGQGTHRRTIFRLLAGLPLLAAAGRPALAAQTVAIERLMREARTLPRIAQRIDFISSKLLGVRYQGHTLIGGAREPEQFVVRDDAFDCVTYCEVVLAAASAGDRAGFEQALRHIRYQQGEVDWRKRNHYFADWCRRTVENKFCRPVMIGSPVKVHKAVNTEPAVGPRQWTLEAIPRDRLLASPRHLAPGDIVGFVSRRATLDYFHTGFVAFGGKGELLLRHASSTRRRVMQEPMQAFFDVNGTEYATVLRPEEPPAPQDVSKASG